MEMDGWGRTIYLYRYRLVITTTNTMLTARLLITVISGEDVSRSFGRGMEAQVRLHTDHPNGPSGSMGQHMGGKKGLETLADSVELAFFSLTARNGASRSLTPYPHIHDASIGPAREVDAVPVGRWSLLAANGTLQGLSIIMDITIGPFISRTRPFSPLLLFLPIFCSRYTYYLVPTRHYTIPPFLCLKYNTNRRISYQLYSIFYCSP
ncbi:uncharacterized protein B0T23DRAFT_229251 [Neurospora hispaniola]|uniref:Uncharacterized protein n=1 Tax=Neurospora hispaniola TaxID=588809 RepID=A0AAJ0MMY1_9PEZI|nr:hypothetical protein B0T23DRAFT_229251 [Neurospora hispaniola]